MVRGKNMKAIEEAITRLENDRVTFNLRIDGHIAGLKEALRLQSGVIEPIEVAGRKRTRRGGLKETVLDLFATAAANGMTTEECVSAANKKGISLVVSSVSSLLSRLKSDDVLFYDGTRYRLKQYAGPKKAA